MISVNAKNNKDWEISSQAPNEGKVQRLAGNGVDYKRNRNGTPTISGEDIVYSLSKERGDTVNCVYKISSCKTNKVYIGISKDVRRRFTEHLERSVSSNEKIRNSKLSRSIRKYGRESFKVDIVLIGDRKYCCLMEVKLIQFYDSLNSGFNMSLGGEGSEHLKPWNKGTRGVCKPNRTTLKPGGISPRQILTDEDKDRVFQEYLSGVTPKEMTWLPVHWSQAYRVIKRRIKDPGFSLKPKKDLTLAREMLLLNESGVTQREIATRFQTTFQLVSDYIKFAKADRLANESK